MNTKLSHSLFKRQYDDKKSFLIQLVINIVIATIVVVPLFWVENFVLFKEIKDFALDKIMYWQSDFEPTLANGQKMQRMVLITIDDQTYRDWGFPMMTPRDKLKGLIEKAVQSGANVIAVDIELAWASDGCIHAPDKPPPACSPALATADKALADYLRDINERDTAPPIILVGMYRKPLQENGTIDKEAFFEKLPSFLDEILKEENNVFWASASFVVDEDRIWRRWQLAPLVCQDGHLTVVPSIQLLTALAELHSQNGDTQSAVMAIRELKTRLNEWAKQFSCDVEKKTIAELCSVHKNCPDLTVTLLQKKPHQ
jgi:CHASE2 domain-containing sensor protein